MYNKVRNEGVKKVPGLRRPEIYGIIEKFLLSTSIEIQLFFSPAMTLGGGVWS